MNFLIGKKNIKKYFLFVLLVPLIANLLINILQGEFFFGFQNTSSKLELYNIFLSFFLFLFYFFLGALLKELFKTKYVTSAIVILWLIIFSIDNSLFFLTKFITFKTLLMIVFSSLIILFIYKGYKFNRFLLLIGSFIILRVIFLTFYSDNLELVVTSEILFTSDEQRLWYPAMNRIFDKNYYSVLSNNPYPGYGLLSAYINSLNTFLLIGFNQFKYYLAINYLFLFLFFAFLYEITNEKLSFLFISITFTTIILSSHWFTYLFFGSALSEVVSSFCFGVLFTEIVLRKNKNDNMFLLLIFSFGFIYFSRQFLSSLVLAFILYQAVKFRRFIVLVGLYAFILKFVQTLMIPNTSLDPYINEDNLSNLLFNLDNVSKMFKQFFIDKPVVYLLLIFIILIILNLKIHYKNIDFFSFFIINFVLVVLLLIFIWRKDDVQSSYRYILNVFYLILYPMASSLDSIFVLKKE